ncbi:MAG: type II CAAX endopeptidase family protein [Pseudomonadota bacterium]
MTFRHPDPFESFVAPARATPHFWRLICGVAFVEICFLFGGFALFNLLSTLDGPVAVQFTDGADTAGGDPTYGDTPGQLLMVLAVFIILIWGTVIAAALFHGRKPLSLIGAGPFREFLPFAGITIFVAVLAEVFVFNDPLTAQTQFGTLLLYLPVVLPLLALQTGAEEIYYRGYIQTQLAARFASPLIWMGAPALFFAIAHVNLLHLWAEGAWEGNDGLWILVFFSSGLLAADLTRVTGSIGAAWGWHFGNNVYAILLVSMQGNMTGLALYTVPFGPDDPMIDGLIIGQILCLHLILWALFRLRLLRRENG